MVTKSNVNPNVFRDLGENGDNKKVKIVNNYREVSQKTFKSIEIKSIHFNGKKWANLWMISTIQILHSSIH